MIDKPHLSASQLESLTRCGEAYRRRYLEGDKIPPAMAILRGTAVHHGAAVNFRQKIDSHVDLPASEIVEASIASFEQETSGGYSLTPWETSRGVRAVIGDAKNDIAAMAQVMATEVAPQYQPKIVEQDFRIDLSKSPRDIIGFIDLADVENRVRDFKTANKKKSQAEADNSTQLTIYAAGYQRLTGTPAADVGLEVIYGAGKPQRQLLVSDRGTADFQALANRVNAAMNVLDSGTFLPATPGAWWCSATWCGYWATCPFVNSERQHAAKSKASPKRRTKASPATKAIVDGESASPLELAPIANRRIPANQYRDPHERLLAERPVCHECGQPVTRATSKIDFIQPLGGKHFSNLCLLHPECRRKRLALVNQNGTASHE